MCHPRRRSSAPFGERDIRLIKLRKIFEKLRDGVASLRLRFVLLILFGSALALASYLICHSATYFYVSNVYTSKEERIARLREMMTRAAEAFDFITAAQLRDELLALENATS